MRSQEKMHNLRDDRKMMKAEADEREARLNDPQSAQFADALESISGVVTSYVFHFLVCETVQNGSNRIDFVNN